MNKKELLQALEGDKIALKRMREELYAETKVLNLLSALVVNHLERIRLTENIVKDKSDNQDFESYHFDVDYLVVQYESSLAKEAKVQDIELEHLREELDKM
jgi:hypothetical protein